MQDASDFEEVWGLLDPEGDGEIMRTEISESLSEENAQRVATVLNMPHTKRFNRKKEEL